jgi:aryl-alcohol dehydrogenase-like predicted oxidoreductase
MLYRNLGRTGLKVSEICLGTFNFGNQVTETDSISIIWRALEAGINFLDTSDGYIKGISETTVGKALKGKRQGVVLATKVAFVTGPSVNDRGLSRRHIMDAIEGSLRRLQTDYIDLYYAHVPDYETPIEETLRAYDDLIRQGKVRYIGCSNFFSWQLCKALWVSDVRNLARFECVESPYNLVLRDIEDELVPLCTSEKVGICVYNPLAGGLLTGKYDRTKPPPAGTRFTMSGEKSHMSNNMPKGAVYSKRYWSETNFGVIDQLQKVAKEHGRNMTQLALAWILGNSAISSAICGVSSFDQLDQNVQIPGIVLSPEERAACDEAWSRIRPRRFTYGRPPEGMTV